MSSDFLNLNLRFATPAALRAWLSAAPRPAWAPIGSTYHNTYIPNESQWRGHASMERMQETYAAKGWDRGPHLYLAVGTSADGIFVMTPPWAPGIHAGACNDERFGIEVVGDFQSRPMSAAQVDLLASCAAVLHQWANCPPDIVAHRDCMPGRTCPGEAAYIQKPRIQAELRARMRYTPDSPILAPAGAPYPGVFLRFPTASAVYDRIAVTTILKAYYAICLSVGVDPVLAIAQMAHETGALSSWWCARPRRNPAGIGVNGQTRPASEPQPYPPNLWHLDEAAALWRFGCAFARWDPDAVEAHVGRLLAYALAEGEGTPSQRALIVKALAIRPLPSRYRGIAPTLQGLEGTWAVPGTLYADSIATWANRLVGG